MTSSLLLAAVKKHGQWGYLASDGKLQIPCQYDQGQSFSEDKAVVYLSDRCGVIDPSGEQIIPFEYEWLNYFSEGRIAFRKIGQKLGGFLDYQGEEIIAPQFVLPDIFSENLASVKKEKLYGYINQAGHETIPFVFEYAGAFMEGSAPVLQKGQYGAIDHSGQWLIYPKFSFLGNFSEGLAAAMNRSGNWGFVDRSGDWLIPPQYSQASYFSEGLAAVCKNDKWGFIDLAGEQVIDFSFEESSVFRNGLARMSQGAHWGLIGRDSKWKISPIYTVIFSLYNGFIPASIEDKAGYLDREGNISIPFDYEESRPFVKVDSLA